MSNKSKKALEAELELANLRAKELEAQLAGRIAASYDAVNHTVDYHGSAILLTITGLGGKVIVPTVAILDGLSQASVEALREDLKRSYRLATIASQKMT